MAATSLRKRNLVILVILSAMVVVLCGCSLDPYRGKRPIDYPNTKWVCSEPRLSFSSEDPDNRLIIEEDVELPDKTIIGWGRGARMDIIGVYMEGDKIQRSDKILACDCTFYKDKLVARVTTDQLFKGKYLGKTIVFYREDLPQSDGSINGTVNAIIKTSKGTQSANKIPIPRKRSATINETGYRQAGLSGVQ